MLNAIWQVFALAVVVIALGVVFWDAAIGRFVIVIAQPPSERAPAADRHCPPVP